MLTFLGALLLGGGGGELLEIRQSATLFRKTKGPAASLSCARLGIAAMLTRCVAQGCSAMDMLRFATDVTPGTYRIFAQEGMEERLIKHWLVWFDMLRRTCALRHRR